MKAIQAISYVSKLIEGNLNSSEEWSDKSRDESRPKSNVVKSICYRDLEPKA